LESKNPATRADGAPDNALCRLSDGLSGDARIEREKDFINAEAVLGETAFAAPVVNDDAVVPNVRRWTALDVNLDGSRGCGYEDPIHRHIDLSMTLPVLRVLTTNRLGARQ
jgi:hypothetical protein